MVKDMLCWLLVIAMAVTVNESAVIQLVDLPLCEVMDGSVDRSMTDMYVVQPYQNNSCDHINNTSTPVLFRVAISASDSNLSASAPIVFVARSHRNITTWQLPLKLPIYPAQFSQRVERTLCSAPPSRLSQWGEEGEEVIIDVFTSSSDKQNYTVEVMPVEQSELKLDEEVQLEVSANAPEVRYFEFKSSASLVKVKAKALVENVCFVLSAQKASCPLDDIPEDGLAGWAHQTMLNKTTLYVSQKAVNGSKFFLVIMVTRSSACNSTINDTNDTYSRTYALNITISEVLEATSFPVAMVLPVLIFLILSAIVMTLYCIPLPKFIVKEYNPVGWLCNKLCKRSGEHQPLLEVENILEDTAESLLDKRECDLRLSDLLRTPGKDLVAQYHIYGWNTITVGIFYGLPALQFVFGQQLLLYITGNQELCYFNFECANPWGILSAFNNIWSNIGYMIFGIAFIAIVKIRHHRDKHSMEEDFDKFWSKGVPQLYGVYYAMGFGLVLEGFMSSFYHICPSQYNFQFDTTFMFIILGLLTVKLLQSRHPDINANAFLAFFCFAVVVFLTMVGIYTSNFADLATKIALLIVLLVLFVLYCMSFYYFHNYRLCHLCKTDCARIRKWLKDTFTHGPKRKIRLTRLTITALINTIVGVCMVSVNKKFEVPTIVLALFITNFLTFLLFYIIFKIVYKEAWTLAALLNLVLLCVLWVAALVMKYLHVTNSELTPSESRTLNKPCVPPLSFYDNHDVWHFLSACAMFFSFLFMLTIDDGIKDVPTKDIPVF